MRTLALAMWAVISVVALAACGSDEAQRRLAGYTLDPPTQVGDLTLPDAATGEPFAFRAAPGHLLVVYFGYTACPDVCPTTLATLRAAIRSLDHGAERIDLAMATVDPARDTADILPGYVRSFVAGGAALRTDDDIELRAVTDRFGATYRVTVDGPKVEVSHSGAMYVVDETGAVLDVLPFGLTKDDVANDLAILLDRGGS